MSVDDNKKLIRNFIEEVINTGDVTEIENFISPNYTEIHEGRRYATGIKGAKEHVHGVRQTYHDLKLTVEQQIGEGEWVATCITARGIHNGSWLGIKPTGKDITFTSVNINKVVNGKIVEHGGAANMFGPLLQAGAIQIVAD